MSGRRVLKLLLAFVIVPLMVGALALVVLATTPWGNERVRRIVVSQGNDRLTGELIVDRLRGNLFTGATLTNVQVMDSLKHPVFAARGVQVRYALLPALRGQVVIRSIVLDTPVVVLDKRPGERWNFQSLVRPSTSPRDSSAPKGPKPQLGDITIRHGRFLYRRPWRPDSSLTREKRDVAIAAALDPAARKRTVRVPGGYQRIVDYRNIDAKLPSVRLAQGAQPTAVQIAALSMLAEPYRPPSLDIRSLVGTLYASKDSLWWRDARMVMPGSNVRGDGKIGFRRSGFTLDLTGAPIALADLRWLDPKLATTGGGAVRYRMRLVGDTAEFAISDADLRYRDASVVGNATVARVKPTGKPAELLVRGADLTVARLSTAIIRELAPSVKVTRSGVLDGRLIVRGTPSALELNADLRFDDAAAGRSHIVARGGVGFAGGVRARNLSVRMDPLQVATLTGAGLKIPLGGTMSGSAVVNGAQREGWSVSGDLAHADRGERSHVTGSGRYAVVGKRIVADATLEPLSLVTVGRFAPDAQLRGSVSGRVHAEGTTKALRINGVIRSRDGGAAEGRGTVALAGARTRYDVSVALDALNASAFSRRAPRTKLTGTISARGAGTKPATANAAFAVALVRSAYDTFSIERVKARGALANGLLRLDTLDAADRGIRASATGTLGLVASQRGTLQFSATVDSLRALRRWIGTDSGIVSAPGIRQGALLAAARADSARRAQAVRIEQLALGLPQGVALVVDTLPGIRRDSLAGSLTASGVVRGNVKAPGVDAVLAGVGLVARGYGARRLDAKVSSPDVRDRTQPLAFDVAADTVRAASYAFERIDAVGRWQGEIISASLRARQDSLVSYAALGSYGRPAKGSHVVRVDSLNARFDTLVWRLAHPGGVRLANGSITVDSLDLRSSEGGRLFGSGSLPKEGVARLNVAVENVRVATILAALQRSAAGDGVVNASANITGTRASPRIAGMVRLREARYGEFRAPDADVTTTYFDKVLSFDAIARDSMDRRVLTARGALPLDLALEKIGGSRKGTGPLTADVVLDSLRLEALPIRPRILDELRGAVAADAHVRGTWASPTYSGVAALRDGALRMSLASTGMRVDDAMADIRLAGDSLVLDSLVARARGPLRASGSMDLSNRSRPLVRLTASGTDLRVFDSPRGLVDADAQIVAEGPLDALRVTGSGEMKGGYLALKQFRKDLLRVKAPGELSFFTIYDTAAAEGDSLRVTRLLDRKPPPRVAIIADLSLVIKRGNFYRNRPDANTEFYTGEGEVVRAHLDQRTKDSWAIGFVRIGDAGGAVFRTRAFVTSRGSMTFVPHTATPASTQQVGERIVWEPGRGLFPVQLLTGGTSTGPAIGLESGTLFPMRGRELNGYLTMGRLSLSLLQQSGSSLSGSSAWSGQLSGETGALARRQQGATALGVVLHDIGTGTTKEYGLDAFAVSPADVPTELVFGKTGGVRGALIEGGKYVTTDLFVAGQLRFTTGIPGFRVARKFANDYRVDVGIEPRFLFRAPEDLGITHPTERSGAFGVFLTKMWSLW